MRPNFELTRFLTTRKALQTAQPLLPFKPDIWLTREVQKIFRTMKLSEFSERMMHARFKIRELKSKKEALFIHII